MSELDPKKIADLRVVDLRAELEKRGLDKNGVKKDLVERLQKALQNENGDSKTVSVDLNEKKLTKRTSTSSNLSEDSASKKADENTINTQNNTDEGIEKSTIAEQTGKKPTEETVDNDNKASDTENNGKVTETIVIDDKNDQEQDKTTAEEIVQDQQATTTTSEEEKKNNEEKSGESVSGTGGEETTQQKKSQSNPKLLWISNVPKNTRANEIKQLLSTCGKVICAKVVVNARFPGSCCFGYVTMGSAEDATNVIKKLNNTEFDGHIIKIDKFENVKGGTLNPLRKKSSEELKRSEKKEDKPKKSPENKPTEKVKNDDKETTDHSAERRKSVASASEHSSRGRLRTRSRERLSKDRTREREREYDRNASYRSDARHRANEERERQRMRDRERALREDNRRRRHEEAIRIREMRYEAERLEREREKLRMERDKIEKEKTQLIKLEKERQRIEREKLEMEKMELERTRIRLEEDRRAAKRPMPMNYRHDNEQPFDDRKRMAPEPERHFERPAPPRFDAPSHGSSIAPKKFGSKDYNKRPQHEGFGEKRGTDFNSERMHQGPPINRSEDNLAKYNRSYDNREPARDVGGPMRFKDNRYNNSGRERSPQFRQTTNLDRHMPPGKPERKSFEQSGDRWNQPTGNIQPKFGGSSSQNQWSNKGTSTWRLDPPTDRWATSTPSSGRSTGQYSGNNKFGPGCPPPPGINNYEYGKPGGGRRY